MTTSVHLHMRRPTKFLLYSHDSFGLGHLRRSLNIAAAIAREDSSCATLILSGTPVPAAFEMPPRCDLVKLPSITKALNGAYASRSLPLCFEDLRAIRSDLILATARAFRPEVFLVDHTAAGPGRELVPVLERLRSQGSGTRFVLGMRDIVDDVPRTLSQMKRERTIETIRRFYESVLVYGDRKVFDAVSEYAFPNDVRALTEHTGIVCRGPRAHRPRCPGPQRLLATAGGGADGYRLLRGVMAVLRGPLRDAQIGATLLTGPLMSDRCHDALLGARQGDRRIDVVRHSDAIGELLADADLVVSMGGYNSIYESLSAGCRLIVAPREFPRREQLERAQRLARLGIVRLLDAGVSVDPTAFARAITEELGAEAATPALDFGGADRAARILARRSTQCMSATS